MRTWEDDPNMAGIINCQACQTDSPVAAILVEGFAPPAAIGVESTCQEGGDLDPVS